MAKSVEIEHAFVTIEAATKPLEEGVARAKKTVADLGKNGGATLRLEANITDFKIAITRAKKALQDAKLDPEKDRAVIAKLEADIGGFEAKLAKAQALALKLTDKPLTAKLEADVTGVANSLKRAESNALTLAEKLSDAGADAGQTFGEQLKDGIDSSDRSMRGLATTAANAFKSPIFAAGVLAAGLVKIAYEATQAASAFHDAFLPVRSTLDLSAEQTEGLQHALTDLSRESPRTADSLAQVAGALAKMGESDPKELAADVRTLALAGDALGKTDLVPLADTLDLLGDAFQLTAQQAREAFTQIAAITHGKIDIEEFGNVLSKSAPRLRTLGIDAQQAASAITTLVDAGVNGRQVTTGLIDLLDKASTAQRDAIAATADSRDGDARLLELFAKTVNATTIESRGLVGALGDLFRAFDGNAQLFDQAKISVGSMTLAQVSANASTREAKTETLSYAESLAKLQKSAETNKESAAALAQILKNDLSAVLVDVGNVFLPPVITAMTALVNLFSRGRAEASAFAADLKKLPGLEARIAAGDKGTVFAGAEVERNRIVQSATDNISKKGPEFLSGTPLKELVDLQAAFASFFQSAGGLDKGGPIRAALDEITKAIVSQTTATDEAALASAAKGAADAKAAAGAVAYANASAETKKAAERFKDLTKSANEFATALGNTGDPIGLAKDRIATLVAEMQALIPTLKATDQAAATNALAKFSERAAAGFERLKAVNLVDLRKKLADLTGSIDQTASDAIGAQYNERIAELREVAAAAVVAGDQYASLNAEIDVDRLERRRDALKGLADLETKNGEAVEIATRFLSSSDASYRGLLATQGEYAKALETLAQNETTLKAIASDATQGKEVQALAEAKLNKLIAERNRLMGVGSSAGVVDATVEWGKELQNVLGVVQLVASALEAAGASIGRGLRESASGLQSVLAGAKGLQNAGKDSSGNKLTGVSQAVSYIGPVGQVVGGVIAIAGALNSLGDQAEERAEELRKGAIAFNRSLADYGRDVKEQGFSDFEKAKAALYRDTGSRVSEAALTSGVKGAENISGTQSAASLRLLYEAIHDRIQNGPKLNEQDLDALVAFGKKILDLSIEAKAKEALLESQHTAEIQRNTEDLGVRALVAQGRDAEAAQLRTHLDQQRELAAAQVDTSETGLAYWRSLQKVIDAENAAAEAAKRDPLKEFQNRAKLFGITGAEYLSGLAQASAAKFKDVSEALQGLDLSTQAGIDGLKQRSRDLYAQFLANDGVIDEAEQATLDALYNIGVTAADVFDSIAERVERALSKAGEENSILGGDARERFGRTANASKGFSSVLDSIIAGIDLSNEPGVNAAKQQLRDLYTSLAVDGISETEAPIVQLIRQMLGGIGEVWDEELAALDADIADAEAARVKRRGGADRFNSVNDLEGTAAFANVLATLPEGIRDMFDDFNLNTAEGVEAAKAQLRTFNNAIAGLTDEEILAKFGVTGDVLSSIILGLDSEFDKFADGLTGVADATRDATNATKDFVDAVTDDFLRATGRSQEADIASSKKRTSDRIADGVKQGVSQEVLNQIATIGAEDIKAINQRYADQSAASVARDTTSASSAGGAGKDPALDFTATSIKGLSSVQGTSIGGHLQVLGVIGREHMNIDREGWALMRSIFAGGLPQLRVPALPAGAGGFQAQGRGSSGGANVYVTINVAGNLSTRDAARQLARDLAPLISQEFRRESSNLSALSGGLS